MSKKNGKDKPNGGGTIALNKRARHEYAFEQKLEAGLALEGWELKAIRAGRANIGDAYAVVLHGELFLVGAQITPLIQASTHVVANDRRTRKLLLHRTEIAKLERETTASGRTIVPLAIYFSDGYAKVEIAVATGKKEWDKRQTIAARDADRDARRELAERARGQR